MASPIPKIVCKWLLTPAEDVPVRPKRKARAKKARVIKVPKKPRKAPRKPFFTGQTVRLVRQYHKFPQGTTGIFKSSAIAYGSGYGYERYGYKDYSIICLDLEIAKSRSDKVSDIWVLTRDLEPYTKTAEAADYYSALMEAGEAAE